MADVFISYRNTPDRRVIVRRLSTILRAHEITVWWDYGLEAGESYRAQITTELANARVVAPLWCSESILSRWVHMEAELGKDKLVPARLQKVVPPDAFEAIQAADLMGWDGAVGNPRLLEFVRLICKRIGRTALAPIDMIEELGQLPTFVPLPDVAPVVQPPLAPSASPTHDYAFWERQWEKHGHTDNLVALRDIADDAPRIIANQARARIAQIETEQSAKLEREQQAREAEARERAEQERIALAKAAEAKQAEQRYRPEGRLKIDCPLQLVHGAPEGWFKPGSGKTEWFKDIESGPELVVVAAGGAITAPFAIGRFVLTFAEWDAAQAHPDWRRHSGIAARKANDQSWGRGKQPAIDVSWNDAQAYCAWLSKITSKTYRLPTDAEWEYCCRAGTKTEFWWGDEISTEQANYNGNHTFGKGAKGEYRERTVPVDSFAANPWGLYQVHGNVWEWCEDAAGASSRVLRGGSWDNYPRVLRSANRYNDLPEVRFSSVGFRVARTL